MAGGGGGGASVGLRALYGEEASRVTATGQDLRFLGPASCPGVSHLQLL